MNNFTKQYLTVGEEMEDKQALILAGLKAVLVDQSNKVSVCTLLFYSNVYTSSIARLDYCKSNPKEKKPHKNVDVCI